MTLEKLRPQGRPSKYSDITIDRALALLALNGGNLSATARDCQASDDPELQQVRAHTIANWRDAHSERYRWHVTENSGEIERRLVQDQREVAAIAASGVRAAMDLEIERIRAGEVKDASASARNLATVMGIATTKVLELTGRPTTIIEHRRPEQVVERLSKIIESTAEEIPNETAD